MSSQVWKLIRQRWDFEAVCFEEARGVKKILGRSEYAHRDNNLIIHCDSNYVSRKHCVIKFKNGVFYVKDLKSSNGTFLNGQRIEVPRELRSGDLLGLGVSCVAECPTEEYFLFSFEKSNSEDEMLTQVIPLITLGSDEDDEESTNSEGTVVAQPSYNRPGVPLGNLANKAPLKHKDGTNRKKHLRHNSTSSISSVSSSDGMRASKNTDETAETSTERVLDPLLTNFKKPESAIPAPKAKPSLISSPQSESSLDSGSGTSFGEVAKALSSSSRSSRPGPACSKLRPKRLERSSISPKQDDVRESISDMRQKANCSAQIANNKPIAGDQNSGSEGSGSASSHSNKGNINDLLLVEEENMDLTPHELEERRRIRLKSMVLSSSSDDSNDELIPFPSANAVKQEVFVKREENGRNQNCQSETRTPNHVAHPKHFSSSKPQQELNKLATGDYEKRGLSKTREPEAPRGQHFSGDINHTLPVVETGSGLSLKVNLNRLEQLAASIMEDRKKEDELKLQPSTPRGQKRRNGHLDDKPLSTGPDVKKIKPHPSPTEPSVGSKLARTAAEGNVTSSFKHLSSLPTLLPAPAPKNSEELDLVLARTRIKNNISVPRKAIQLSHTPGCEVSNRLSTTLSLKSSVQSKCSFVESRLRNPFHKSGIPSKKHDDEPNTHPGVEKRHTQGRVKARTKSTNSLEFGRDKSLQALTGNSRLPGVCPAQAAQMPVAQILQDMNKPDVVIEDSRINQPKAVRPAVDLSFYKNLSNIRNASSRNDSPSTSGAAQSKSRSDAAEAVANSIPDAKPDQVYRDILNWSPLWLKEQLVIKELPPVIGDRKLVTNLPGFLDYPSYISTFYPLMLLELWANITQDSNKTGRRGVERTSGKCDFQVVIDKVELKEECPMLPILDKRKQLKQVAPPKSKPKASSEAPHWHCLKLISLTENKDLNSGNDFGILKLDIMKNGKKYEREVFGIFLFETETYDDAHNVREELRKLFSSTVNFMYSATFVTHLKEHSDIIRGNVASVRKFSYISPRLRDFRAVSLLPASRLFSQIINPTSPPASEVFQPNICANVAGLIKEVVDTLNPIQRGIVQYTSNRLLTREDPDLLLIHGPPGTGKTKTICGLVLQLLKGNQSPNTPRRKLLLCTPSNTAIDEIIRRLSPHLGDTFQMVRVGQNAPGPDVKKFNIDDLARKRATGGSQTASIRNAIETTAMKITQIQTQIDGLGRDPSNAALTGALVSQINDLKKKKNQYQNDLSNSRCNKKALDRAKAEVLRDADVVCCTLNSCSSSIMRRNLGPPKFQQDAPSEFTCCIIDEATQTTEPESLSPLMLNCDKLVLVGDPMQLPATVLSNEADNRDYGQSLFTRLYNFYQTQTANPVMMLTQQYRMNSEILHWPNLRFYQNKLTTPSSVENDEKRKLRLRPYLFLNINNSQENVNEKRQFSNAEEVRLIREVLHTIKRKRLSANHSQLTIGIITPYNEQRVKLLVLLEEFKKIDSQDNTEFSKSIEIDTVDSFQGREKDIIILSCVRTEELGFLKTPQRLNVSLTRAKMCLYVVGNANCLNMNEMWKSLMDDAVRRGLYKTVPVYDPVHLNDYRQKVEAFLLQN